jgi:ATP-dependent DNA ligase
MFDCALYSSDEVRISGSTISKKIKLEDRTYLNLAKGLSKALDQAIKEAIEAVMANQKTRHY